MTVSSLDSEKNAKNQLDTSNSEGIELSKISPKTSKLEFFRCQNTKTGFSPDIMRQYVTVLPYSDSPK